MNIPLLNPERHWVCPNCTVTAVTKRADVHTEFHNCRSSKLAGLWAPLVEDGVRAKVEPIGRGDYLNGDIVRRDGEGRVVMNVTTTRDDGEDCAVYAGTATGSLFHA